MDNVGNSEPRSNNMKWAYNDQNYSGDQDVNYALAMAAGAPGTPMVTTAWVVRLGSNSLPMERWRLPVEDTPLEDWTESVLRHLDCLVFRPSSLPGMVGSGSS